MKKQVITAALFILISAASFSQESEPIREEREYREKREYREPWQQREIQTLLGHNQPGGGYGAFSIGYSMIDDRQAILFGGKFAWIASHSVGFGFAGTGFINEFHYEPLLDKEVALAGGYGGLYIEPILMPRFPVHLSFPVLFGGGGISYVSKKSELNNNLIEESKAFLIIEPGAELELNLTRHFRFAVGASYRFPSAFDLGLSDTPIVNAEALRGMSYMVTFKFGRF
jgi:hypothetical protein